MNSDQLPLRPLERLFHSTYARVLDFLILNQKFDYSHSDISRLANVPPRSLQRILPVLQEERLVIKTRKSGKTYMYIFNGNSEKGKALQQYFDETLKSDMDFVKNSSNENIEAILRKQIEAE